MATQKPGEAQQFWENFYGPNQGYLFDLYEHYLQNPASVDPATRAIFDEMGAPPLETVNEQPETLLSTDLVRTDLVGRAAELVRNIRAYGHLSAKINPLESPPELVALLQPKTYDLSATDLKSLAARAVIADAPTSLATAWDVVNYLTAIYTGTTAFEFRQIQDVAERDWLDRYVEQGYARPHLSPAEQRDLLQRLITVEQFERFLHGTFPGQKRFSIEGTDVLVPMLDTLTHLAAHSGIPELMIGMAHRGRLSVLAHNLGKPYKDIFSEFHTAPNKDMTPSEGSMGINFGWTGDVKYHLGAKKTLQESNMVEIRLTLANNPSHLEFVDPVVEGYSRAAQDNRRTAGAPDQQVDRALPILIHGDAAFPGEGIVAETLNLSGLRGYYTGGTIHIIANNNLGFTTETADERSTLYASDLAKGFEIPIVHVNADDPEACLAAVQMAYAYRQQYHKDFLIDVVGYRRWGHNEGDDPSITQPTMYTVIGEHPTVATLYGQKLSESGVVTKPQIDEMIHKVQDQLRHIYAETAENPTQFTLANQQDEPATVSTAPISADMLRQFNEELLTWPKGFSVNPKLERILMRRKEALDLAGGIDWAHAEALAFASIIADGTPTRLSGQDSERGTFSQRHLVLHDMVNGATYTPLQHLSHAQASFAVYNSPLSEASVLGFEYGYSVQAPDALVLWEAQYGDFANSAQVMIDQFIAPGRAKWRQQSSLVLLLPHGYEGMGPEHSSGRLERYLQLSAEENWTVTNPTNAAQYFHLLRSQAARLQVKPRPLVIMAPKSLLRNTMAYCSLNDLVAGEFQPILAHSVALPETVTRLVLCSGKISIELDVFMKQNPEMSTDWIQVARVEQLFPFPESAIAAIAQSLPNLKEVVWLQEEPQNMGAWHYIKPYLDNLLGGVPITYIGRPPHASPAEGQSQVHAKEQRRILTAAVSAIEEGMR
ncbi:MAG: 2-oxoglutarate dehydrogenase E1 component [Sulfobacillus benefaciens]|uniref:oxoglutarate dehydrogenase (succinyl-transferring) n=1 Tax=Sulfobacillus benefaciens TaxID=453960 RepID=A0A2T2XES6_9FIRM|nr:MAG: 2-oxoglutarate dehydrogenase E1 component [Sulfobacillus benefaciens]